jgi:O-antigen/teichoic acid export membrane protein
VSEVFSIGKNTLAQVIGKIITAGTTFLVLAMVARRFGEAGTGEFTLILSFTALFYLIADFGLNAFTVKRMVTESKKAPFYFSNLLGLRLCWSFLLVILAILISRFLPYSRTFKFGVLVACLTIVTQAIVTTANVFFQSRLRYDQSVFASALGSLTTVFLVYLFNQRNFSLVNLLFAYPIGGLVMTMISLFIISTTGGFAPGGRYSLFIIRPAFNLSFWRNLFLSTLPLSLTLLVDLVHFKIDAFVLAFFRPITEVGNYNVAYKVFENILVFPVFFVNSLYPFLIKKYTGGLNKLAFSIKKAGLFLFLVSILCLLFLVIFAPIIIHVLTGRGFENSILALRVLALTLPPFFITALLMWVLITLGRQWLLFKIYTIAMILDLILNLVFIPKFGFLAAAVVTGGTETLLLILEVFFVLKLLNKREK